LYVSRREKLVRGGAFDGAGKRAAFALFYSPLHLLTVRAIVAELGATRVEPALLVDLGCGTLGAGAGWALGARAAGRELEVVGVERQGWAAAEARFTLSALQLRGRVIRQSLETFDVPARVGALLAAFTVNELDDAARAPLLPRLIETRRRGALVLVVEPLARKALPWWDDWARAFVAAGGRADEWRLPAELPERLRLMDRAAGLDHARLTARSLFLG
jgi:hypothetical protein